MHLPPLAPLTALDTEAVEAVEAVQGKRLPRQRLPVSTISKQNIIRAACLPNSAKSAKSAVTKIARKV